MRKILSLVLVALLICPMAFADRVGQTNVQTVTFTGTCAHVYIGPVLIHQVLLKAAAAQNWMGIIDSGTAGDLDNDLAMVARAYEPPTTYNSSQYVGRYKFIAQEATQYDTNLFEFDPPIKCSEGIYVYGGTGAHAQAGTTNPEAIIYIEPTQ